MLIFKFQSLAVQTFHTYILPTVYYAEIDDSVLPLIWG